MSSKRLAIQGVALNWFGIGCQIGVSFFVTRILFGNLGPEKFGLWSIMMSLTAYYILADLGLRGACTKYISQFKAQGDQESVNKIVVTAFRFYLKLAPAVLGLSVIVAIVFPRFFNIKEAEVTHLSIGLVVILTGVSVAVILLGQIFDASLVAMKRFDLTNMVTIGSLLLQGTLIVLAVTNGYGLLAMAMIVVFVSILNQSCRFILSRRVLGPISLSKKYFDKKTMKTLFHFGSLNLAVGTARNITTAIGTLIIGALLGPAAVAFYVIPEELSKKVAQLSIGITGPLMPVASELDAQGRHEELRRAFLLATSILLSLGLMMLTALTIMGSPFLDFWLDNAKQFDDYPRPPSYYMYPILCVLLPGTVLTMSSNAARGVLMGMNRMGYLASVAILDVILTVSLGVVLVSMLRPQGMAFATQGMAFALLISQFITGGILIPQYACRALKISVWEFLRSSIAPALLAAIPGLVVGLALLEWAEPSNLLWVVIECVAIGVVSMLSIFTVCFDRAMQKDILSSLLALAGIKKKTSSTPKDD